jgi:hypothetical protein
MIGTEHSTLYKKVTANHQIKDQERTNKFQTTLSTHTWLISRVQYSSDGTCTRKLCSTSRNGSDKGEAEVLLLEDAAVAWTAAFHPAETAPATEANVTSIAPNKIG